MPYKFKPPTVSEGPIGMGHRLWQFYEMPRGVTVVKTIDGYYSTRFISQEEMNEASVVYLGGHEYMVSDEEAAALTAAGYGDGLTEIEE